MVGAGCEGWGLKLAWAETSRLAALTQPSRDVSALVLGGYVRDSATHAACLGREVGVGEFAQLRESLTLELADPLG